jgi:programmed cell death protein 5
MPELDEIRKKRLKELVQQQAGQQVRQQMEQQMQSQQVEEQINLIMRRIMTPEARERLSNIRLARPEFARQVEILLIQLFQGGRLKELNDEQFKGLLAKISGTRREPKIQMR